MNISNLPAEIIDIIAKYTGGIKWRNGRYMRQILASDPRYEILQTIPQKKYINTFSHLPPDTRRFYVMITLSVHEGLRISLEVSGFLAGSDIVNYVMYAVDYYQTPLNIRTYYFTRPR